MRIIGLLLIPATIAVLPACERQQPSSWSPRPPPAFPPTTVIDGITVVRLSERTAEPTPEEVADFVKRFRGVGKRRPVRKLTIGRMHPTATLFVSALFEYHEVRARTRRCYSSTISKHRRDGVASWSDPSDRIEKLEVCAPHRSFRDPNPVPREETLTLGVWSRIPDHELLDIIDSVYDSVPEGQRIRSIGREDTGALHIYTVDSCSHSALSGLVLHIVRTRSGWRVDDDVGQWRS